MADIDIIVVCGPTASGKTALAVELAKRIDAEIVSADSMQIYKEMNVGTAKPDMEERGGIRHHMLDVVSVTEDYNVSRYVSEATRCIENIRNRGKKAILAGGTGLYIDSLINNIDFFEIENDYEYRAKLLKCAEENGNMFVHDMLRTVDPDTACRLHPNDLKRVIRALEVYKVTGKTMSLIQRESVRERRYNTLFSGIDYADRSVLYERIERRVGIMIRSGLPIEARKLMNYNLSATARAAIGYCEMFEYFEHKISLDEAVLKICKRTRNYAKRQLTWFRKNKEINWLYPDLCNCSAGELADSVCEKLNLIGG